MQSLHRARFIARLVLAWFALSLGSGIAAPMVNPQAIELVCSGSGAMKLLVKDGEGNSQAVAHTMDCPLFATTGAPPPSLQVTAPAPAALSHALQTIPRARIAALTAGPPPGRGPPLALPI